MASLTRLQYTLETLQEYTSAIGFDLHKVLESRGVKVPEELKPGNRMKWRDEVKLPSTESLLETLRSMNPDLD